MVELPAAVVGDDAAVVELPRLRIHADAQRTLLPLQRTRMSYKEAVVAIHGEDILINKGSSAGDVAVKEKLYRGLKHGRLVPVPRNLPDSSERTTQSKRECEEKNRWHWKCKNRT